MRLTPELLLQAYAVGVFPMAESRKADSLHWVAPERRGLLSLNQFHAPRRLLRTFRSGKFFCTLNHAPHEVIHSCATAHGETWINQEIEELYCGLATRKTVHSIEVWQNPEASPTLVGGLYGLALGGIFFGESMFSLARDASKVALVELVLRLRHGGFVLLDTQFLTPHLAQFGIEEITREAYQEQLAKALTLSAALSPSFTEQDRAQFLSTLSPHD